MKDSFYLNLAIETAIANPILKLPKMAAVLITPEGGIFIGRNQLKSHPLQAAWGARNGRPKSIFLHAETDAIVKALKQGMETIDAIYIARVSKRGIPALARPCDVCLALLAHFNVRKIQWTV
jgi:tRNA(Arg) A34 adenosine deaminase TadA